jgi:hypothetical protein
MQERPNEHDVDTEFLASVTILLQKIGAFTNCKDDLKTLKKEISRHGALDAARVAALKYVPSLSERLIFPTAYYWHKRAKAKLERQDIGPLEEQHWTNDLIRNAALLEFTVRVNARWYFILKLLVDRGILSASELKCLLKTYAVSWTKDGELVIGHHWVTKFFISFFIAFVLFGWGMLIAWTYRSYRIDPVRALAVCIGYSCGFLAPLIWGVWYIGPFSWKAARNLTSLQLIRENHKKGT